MTLSKTLDISTIMAIISEIHKNFDLYKKILFRDLDLKVRPWCGDGIEEKLKTNIYHHAKNK